MSTLATREALDNGLTGRSGIVRRETLLAMLWAALNSGEYRFARQASLAWLAAFPGDLEISLLQARAMMAEGRPGDSQNSRVIPALDLVCRKDPFSLEAFQLLAEAARKLDPVRYGFALTCCYVLDGRVPNKARLEPWGIPLRQAFTTIAEKKYLEAEKCIQDAFRYNPDLLLGAVLHLLVDRAVQDPLTVFRLADIYHARWPDCLPVGLVLAEAHLELGNEPEAVRLMHLCAAGDAAGQTAARLWGAQHPYRSLWPEDMLIPFDLPIPAPVAAWFGWNRLNPGEARASEKPAPEAPAAPSLVDWTSGALDLPAADPSEEPGDSPAAASQENNPDQADNSPLPEPAPAVEAPAPVTAPASAEPALQPNGAAEAAAAPEVTAVPESAARPGKTGAPRRSRKREKAKPAVRTVAAEFERLARKLKQPELAQADGRQPVYVIFTSREGLVRQYGPQTAAILMAELSKLAGIVRRPGWGALVYYPDDAACTAEFNLTPVNPRDPWKLKNALADLDQALGKRGQMIGALLIAGGDSVLPFHRLPNPTGDSDVDIASDSPYATRDANYFVPEWPVGRLPGEKGADAGLLLEQIRLVQRNQSHRKKGLVVFGRDWFKMLRGWIGRLLPLQSVPSFGYTAAVWRRSSLAVFRPIGAPHTVVTSPPVHSGSVDRSRVSAASLSYYNLHGLEDSPAWYGQRDPLDKNDAPDYPVALSPEDLKRNGHAPRVIFSEACYGGHVSGKSESESLALKFLSVGTQAVIASTAIAYGSLSTPLTAADMLGHLFWRHLKTGRTAGEALVQAKVDLVREMDRRQGFLDGEDQKTLISFVLYGDPLTVYDGYHVQSKALLRAKEHPHVRAVSDHAELGTVPPNLTGEALRQVKQIVAEYLPGADLAQMRLVSQPSSPNGKPGSALPKNAENAAGRMVVTVSKQVRMDQHVHKHFVRVTLDEGGKPVKMSISR